MLNLTDPGPLLSAFSAIDWAAAALTLATLFLSTWVIEHPPKGRPSTHVLMHHYRRAWLHEMALRDVRIFDAQLLATLRQGTAFFASTTMIAIGGGAAALGRTEQLDSVASDLNQALSAPIVVWEVKILFVIAFLTFAFLKFVWSMRLFGYCAVLMAATPSEQDPEAAMAMATRAARVNILADRAFTRGLRGLYFAIAALGWFLGPAVMIGAVLLTGSILWRREFKSQTRTALLEGMPRPWTPS
ncbi:DUF599 family protein [Rhodobacteraceae bacterium 2CG4]|uniref:DUF599 family protein n=1 Tax=Halovulum marinum TaxID=2662447 RepID=A0A6L5Z1G7_9RHOB|nr:DUF599 domain-containing protein [Halovulum marinum]MSU90406.1 DUF599 family protein [Halovulum marinum]